MWRIFASSSIRFDLVWSLPPVGDQHVHVAGDRRIAASYTTADGSAPGACATTWPAPGPPQVRSCSMAAARKVSPAASSTVWPSAR